jgi:hypothetical protein
MRQLYKFLLGLILFTSPIYGTDLPLNNFSQGKSVPHFTTPISKGKDVEKAILNNFGFSVKTGEEVNQGFERGKVPTQPSTLEDIQLHATEMPLGRLSRWKGITTITVYVGGGKEEVNFLDRKYLVDSHQFLTETVEEINREFEEGKVPIRLIEIGDAQQADIFLGYFRESQYIKKYPDADKSLLSYILSRYAGVTLIYDQKGSIWALSKDYDDKTYAGVDALIEDVSNLVKRTWALKAYEGTHLVLPKNQVDALRLLVKGIAKHELFHALGLAHVEIDQGEGCSITATNSNHICLKPASWELNALKEKWSG